MLATLWGLRHPRSAVSLGYPGPTFSGSPCSSSVLLTRAVGDGIDLKLPTASRPLRLRSQVAAAA
jgi:hypothetical protein